MRRLGSSADRGSASPLRLPSTAQPNHPSVTLRARGSDFASSAPDFTPPIVGEKIRGSGGCLPLDWVKQVPMSLVCDRWMN